MDSGVVRIGPAPFSDRRCKRCTKLFLILFLIAVIGLVLFVFCVWIT